MSMFVTFEQLLSTVGDERTHLAQLEEAIQDAVLAGDVAAIGAGLNPELLERALVPLLLTVVARQYLSVCENQAQAPKGDHLAQLASDAVDWAISHGGKHKTIH